VSAAPSLAAVILAGGASRRMGRPKALLPFREQTILDRLIDLYLRFCAPVVVVLGHSPETIRAGITRAGEVRFAVNPDPDRGQLSSLQCGLTLVRRDTLFTPVDYPAVKESTVEILVRRWEGCEAPVMAPSYRRRHGHPVLIREHVRQALVELPVDAMARQVIHRYRDEAVYVEVDDAAVCEDIDRMEDYHRLLAAEASGE
jgi:molybdenum cofactor cytidylyltransferase